MISIYDINDCLSDSVPYIWMQRCYADVHRSSQVSSQLYDTSPAADSMTVIETYRSTMKVDNANQTVN